MAIPHATHQSIILDADDIQLSYQLPNQESHVVLRDFALHLTQGEILAVLGPSGVGKSSLLRVLAGLQPPDRGSVRVQGQPLLGPHPRLGFVFQDPCLLPWLTLEENVAFGLDFTHQPDISKAQKKSRVHDAIAEVDLQNAKQRYPAELSGGMAQRAALARSLARQPDILLLDEPFSALDEITRGEMQTLLQQITARRHASAILVTHDIDEALILADRILLIGQSPGRLIAEWSISQSRPHDIISPELTRIRVDIMQSLRIARGITAPRAVLAA
ncbi:MAG: ABC transporter ATP-binding protein [Burkholderiaceae bacterium]|nr:ABC transporter ATP-binding protein [Burkholderiaceae bacterium]